MRWRVSLVAWKSACDFLESICGFFVNWHFRRCLQIPIRGATDEIGAIWVGFEQIWGAFELSRQLSRFVYNQVPSRVVHFAFRVMIHINKHLAILWRGLVLWRMVSRAGVVFVQRLFVGESECTFLLFLSLSVVGALSRERGANRSFNLFTISLVGLDRVGGRVIHSTFRYNSGFFSRWAKAVASLYGACGRIGRVLVGIPWDWWSNACANST